MIASCRICGSPYEPTYVGHGGAVRVVNLSCRACDEHGLVPDAAALIAVPVSRPASSLVGGGRSFPASLPATVPSNIQSPSPCSSPSMAHQTTDGFADVQKAFAAGANV